MGSFAPLLWLPALAALGAAAGCRSKSPPAAASATASASARPSAAPPRRPPPSTASARRNPSGCRVLGVTGAAASAPGNPEVGRLFQGTEWLELAAEVDVSLRHTESSREFSLRGPGRFRPCKAGTESVAVALGTVTTTAGPGARAGAEVLLATPFAVIRFADAKLTLRVDERKLALEVEQGAAIVEPVARAGKSEPEKTVMGPKGALTHAGKSDAQALLSACKDAQSTAASGAPRPSGIASAGSGLGDWAAKQLKARRSARFACAAADAALGRLEEPELSRLSGLLEAAVAVEKQSAGPPGK